MNQLQQGGQFRLGGRTNIVIRRATDLPSGMFGHWLIHQNGPLHQALQLIQTMQEHLTALSEKEEAPSVTGAKAATVLTLAVWKKIASGKRPSSFDQEDWKEIGRAVSEYAILPDGEQYSIFVFQLYEKYIRASAEMIARFAPPETVEAIMKLATLEATEGHDNG